MKKSLLSLFLILVFIMQTAPALAYSSVEMYTETFNDCVFGEVPERISLLSNAYVNAYGDGDKGIQLIAKDRISSMRVQQWVDGDFCMGFDLYATDTGFKLDISAGDTFSHSFFPVSIDLQGNILSQSGTKTGQIRPNARNRFVVAVNTALSTYCIYLNGVKISDWAKIANTEIKDFYEMKLMAQSSSDAKIFIDNIAMNASTVPQSFTPDDVIIYKGEKPIEDTGVATRLLMNNDFETDSMPGISIYNDADRIEKTNVGGSNSILFERLNGGNNMYIDLSLSSYTAGKLVVESDVKLLNQNSSVYLYEMRDTYANFEQNIRIANGSLIAGSKSSKLAKDTWYKISCVYDFIGRKYDAYLNGELFCANIPITNPAFTLPMLTRISVYQTNDVKFLLDNVRMYTSDTPKTFTPEEIEHLLSEEKANVTTAFPDDRFIETILGNNMVIHMKNGLVHNNGKKFFLSPSPYMSGNIPMVPLRALAEELGYTVRYDSITKSAFIGCTARFTVGSNRIKTAAAELVAECAPVIVDGSIFVPLRGLAQGIGKELYFDTTADWNAGMAVMGDDVSIPAGRLDEINQYAFFYRPSAVDILNDFNSTPKQHPYLLGNADDFERVKSMMQKDSDLKKWVYSFIDRASEHMTYSALAYRVTGDIEYAKMAYKAASDLVDRSGWTSGQYLDVGTNCSYVATVYDWIYDALNAEQRKHLEEGLYREALKPTFDIYENRMSGQENFIYRKNNWNAVCNGGVCMGALATLAVYPEISSKVTEYAVRALEYNLDSYAPDGGYYEGPSYWNYGTHYLVQMFASMEGALGTDYAVSASQGIEGSAEYFLMNEGPKGSFNYGDAAPYSNDFCGTDGDSCLLWMAKKYNRPDIASEYVAKLKDFGRTSYTYTGQAATAGVLWYPESIENVPMKNDACYHGTEEIGIMRSGMNDPNETFVAFKGGVGNEMLGHMHLDRGSFVFDAMGERWALDMGKDDYNLPGYWNDFYDRWFLFRTRGASHNTIVVNPSGNYPLDQSRKSQDKAPITRFITNTGGGFGVVDLSAALKHDVIDAKRGFFFTDERQSLVIRDEVTLKNTSDVYWLMYTDSDDIYIDNNKAYLMKNGKALKLEFISNASAHLAVEDAVPLEGTPGFIAGENKNSGIKRVMIKANAGGKVNITVKLTPNNLKGSNIYDYDVPIDSWNLNMLPTTGTAPEYVPLKLDNISLNGQTIKGFSPDVYNYNITSYEGHFADDVVTAEGAECNVEIINGKNDDDSVRIKAVDKQNPDNFSMYVLNFRLIPSPVRFNGYTSYKVHDIDVSSVPQTENNQYNLFDSNFDTRWSAEGTQEWIKLDLGEIKSIDTVKMSFYMGDKRTQNFKISLSVDGESYSEVYSGASSGKTAGYENFAFATQQARYVRIEFNGTSEGTWNSPSEIICLKRNDAR